jgi:hypothetical protein
MQVLVESWKQVWCRSQARISFQTELLGQFGQNEVRLMIPFRLGLSFKRQNFWFSFAFSEKICPEKAVIVKLGANLKWFRFGETASHESCR